MTNLSFNTFYIFDIFIRNDTLIINISFGNHPMDKNKLKIALEKCELEFKAEHLRDAHEPSHTLEYQITNKPELVSPVPVILSYEEISHSTTCEIVPNVTENNSVALTTLFLNDYKLFPTFYEYYKNEGVDHFYMYYNGIANEEIQTIFDRPGVTLINWNFSYWNPKGSRHTHNAQCGQMHNALYKYGKNNYNYMIFCDLDEYLHIDNSTLKDYMFENKKNYYGFSNIWGRSLPDTPRYPFSLTFLRQKQKLYWGKRSKVVYDPEIVDILGVHYPYKFSRQGIAGVKELDMFHFYNWSNGGRQIEGNFEKITLRKPYTLPTAAPTSIEK